MKKEKENEILNNLTFTPNINKNSNLLYEKTHLKIEDKLYNEFKLIKEKQNYKRLLTEISHRSNMNNNDRNNCKFTDNKNNTIQASKKINYTKTSTNSTKLNQNKSERNQIFYKKSQASNERHNLNINKEHNTKNQIEKRMIFIENNNSNDEYIDLNLDDVSLIKKIKTYNNEESLNDSCLNLKPFKSKYKEEKNANLNIILETRENEVKNSGNIF
jgi:hypothetical protein